MSDNTEVLTHLLGMKIPSKSDRRSRLLKDSAARFVAGEKDPHWSPSGMTAILYAEAVLAQGGAVVLYIHPQRGVMVTTEDAYRYGE